MIFYTEKTNAVLQIGLAVERDSSGQLTAHSTGTPLGVVMDSYEVEESDPVENQSMIYVAGGGGQSLILGADWDGVLTRFEFTQGRAVPVSSGGHGWLIPTLPQTSQVTGDTVTGAIYK